LTCNSFAKGNLPAQQRQPRPARDDDGSSFSEIDSIPASDHSQEQQCEQQDLRQLGKPVSLFSLMQALDTEGVRAGRSRNDSGNSSDSEWSDLSETTDLEDITAFQPSDLPLNSPTSNIESPYTKRGSLEELKNQFFQDVDGNGRLLLSYMPLPDAGALEEVFPPSTKLEENRFIELRNLANEMRDQSYEKLWAQAELKYKPLTVLEQYYLRRFRIETKTQDNAYLTEGWKVALKVCDDLDRFFPTKVTKGISKIPIIGKKVFVKVLIRTVLSKEERKFVRETMARIRYGQRPVQERYGQLAQSNERWDVVHSKIKTKAGCHKDTVLTIQRSFREDSSKEWEQDVEQYQFRYSKMKNLIHKLNKKIKKKVKKSLQQKEYDMATRKWIMYDDFQNQIGGHYLAKLSTHQSDGFFRPYCTRV